MKKTTKKWSGRFSEPTSEIVKRYTASVNFDQRLAMFDIEGSLAHAAMLKKQKVISANDLKLITKGLNQIKKEIISQKFKWSIDLEDVHLNIEKRLTQIVGEPGEKIHTGRSRNDQVATDMRLYLREVVDQTIVQIKTLQKATLNLAEKHIMTIMPGMTHLQVAQPVSFAHHLHAYYEMLERDKSRFQDARKRINVLPLGAAALAGTSFPIDRKFVAKLLKFDEVMENSIDAVSDRDFLIEFVSSASLIMMHLSRFSEEIILWSSSQFDFISLPDSFSTGSSIMPQKKNPDVPELVRGKTGRVTGNLISLLTLMKSQPLAYNKDNQEDKEPLFDSVDTIFNCLHVFADMVPMIKSNKDNMYQSALKGFTTATDLADYLVKKGLAFRDAHDIVGKAVSYGIKENKDLNEFSLDELKSFNKLIEKDVFDVISLEGSINARDHLGGTSIKQVSKAIKAGRKLIK